MEINELVEFVNNNKNKMLKGAQLEELVAKKIEVKKYLSIKDKKALVESIVDECVLYHNGIFKFDDIDKYICFTMKTIEAYTNLELSYDIEHDYDLLCEHGLLETIVSTFKKEYEEINILLNMKCDYILSDSSVAVQIGEFLGMLSNKIDDIVNVLTEKISDFDSDKLPIDENSINKLLSFLNKE